MDGQVENIPTELTPSICKQKCVDEKSNSDKPEKDVHEEQDQEKVIIWCADLIY